MAQTTFEVDPATAVMLQELKATFNARTNAEVIRKAIALARVASRMQDPVDRAITLLGADKQETKVIL